MLQDGLLVLAAPNFRKWWKKCQKKNWMFVWRVVTRCEEERWQVLQKFIDEIHRRATIDRLYRSPPLHKPQWYRIFEI